MKYLPPYPQCTWAGSASGQIAVSERRPTPRLGPHAQLPPRYTVFVCECVCVSADRSMAGHQGGGRRLLRGLPVTSPPAAASPGQLVPSRPFSPPAVTKVTACQPGERGGAHRGPDASQTLMGLSILLRSTRGAGPRVTHTHTQVGGGGSLPGQTLHKHQDTKHTNALM